jgi:hypothetical protein
MKGRLAIAVLRARLAQFPAAARLGALAARGVDAGAHFLRTSDGYEIDLLLVLGGVTVAIEIKLAAHATPQDFARLDRAADLVSAEHRYVVCHTDAPAATGPRGALDLTSAIERLQHLSRARK